MSQVRGSREEERRHAYLNLTALPLEKRHSNGQGAVTGVTVAGSHACTQPSRRFPPECPPHPPTWRASSLRQSICLKKAWPITSAEPEGPYLLG